MVDHCSSIGKDLRMCFALLFWFSALFNNKPLLNNLGNSKLDVIIHRF